MAKTKKRNSNKDPFALARPLDLPDFYARLHQCIGGSGPEGIAWGGTPPAADDPEFRENYLWAEIASKYDPGGGNASLDQAAISQFRENEQTCNLYNSLLVSFEHRVQGLHQDYPDLTLASVLSTAALKIGSLLGRVDWEEIVRHVGFGPGATYSCPRDRAHIWDKIGNQPDCNAGAQALAEAYLASAPGWGRMVDKRHRLKGGISYTCLNRITTVPKDYKKNRVIAVEPVLSMFFQKGIGGVMRRRLKKVGIDLDDQGINQLGAFVGSISDELATIDLKAASDSIPHELVRQLLPPDWLDALEQLRSTAGVLRLSGSTEIVEFRKFSSMGNGYTFELESLIFWALSRAVLDLIDAKDRRLCVYGDDIIVPSVHADLVLAVLSACGFTPNAKKTHVHGPFRESCGKHYLRGADVTPFYIRRPIRTIEDLFLLHNNIVRWASSSFGLESTPGRDIRVKELCEWVRSHAPVRCRLRSIPDGYGDNAFIGDFDECVPKPFGWGQHRCSLHDRSLNKCSCPIGWEGWRATHWPQTIKRRMPKDWRAVIMASLFFKEGVADKPLFGPEKIPIEVMRTHDLLRSFELGEVDGEVCLVSFGRRKGKSLLISGGWKELGIWR